MIFGGGASTGVGSRDGWQFKNLIVRCAGRKESSVFISDRRRFRRSRLWLIVFHAVIRLLR